MMTLRDARPKAPGLLHGKGAFAGVDRSLEILNTITAVFMRQGQRGS